MDLDPRLNEVGADRALHGLFQKAGRLSAPEGMEARVLHRLAALPRPIRPASTLLPNWVWYGQAVAFLLLLYPTFWRTGEASDTVVPSTFFNWVNASVLHSEWVFMGGLCLTALVTLHTTMLRGIRSGR